MKRTVFLALALFALMAVGLYAQTEADFDVSKSADGKSVTITKYKGKATTVNIPAKIQNLPVTEIGPRAFRKNLNITSVTIPNGVTSIGEEAFGDCNFLDSVTIPNGVTSIGKRAFSITSLASITIPNSVISIGEDAFLDSSLTSVTFQGTLPSSGFKADAFSGLGDIRDKFYATDKTKGTAGTYTRPNGTSTAWTKGGSATSAPAAAGTAGLEFALTSDGKGYKVSKGTGADGDVVIPSSYNNLPVTEIANSAFDSSTSIKSVIIPDSVTKIGAMAFNKCVFIKSVTIGSGVKEIGKTAFTNCSTLNSVTFGGANTVFGVTEFPEGSDLLTKYKAGGEGTYTKSGSTWTKK